MIILIIHIIVSCGQNISLIFFMWKMDPISGCDIRLALTLPPRDSTLQYKRCVHLWNNFPCIITLEKLLWGGNFVLGISRSIFDLGLLLIYRDYLVFIQYPQCDITLKGKLKWRDSVLILELQVPKMNIGINLHYEDTSIPALIK